MRFPLCSRRPALPGHPLRLLALAAVCGFAGCAHNADNADGPTAAEITASNAQSDEASVIFAEQEVKLAERQQNGAGAQDRGADALTLSKAQAHLETAQLLQQIDRDRAHVEQELTVWKALLKTPAMR